MANPITKSLREGIIETQKLDIPYDATGFVKWLTETHNMSTKEAELQVQLIRDADLELWEPEDPEIFQLIATWLNDARDSKYENVRTLMYDFVFLTLKSQIENLQELDSRIEEDSKTFLHSVIKAYNYYLDFMRFTLNYSPEDDDLEYDFEEENDDNESVKRYAPIPLEKEYKNYLIDRHFTQNTRHKTMTNLRKLNSLVINNGRGDSDWLQKLADKARAGVNIRYAHVQAHNIIHTILKKNDETDGINVHALKGGLTSINHYLDFLISTYCKSVKEMIKQNSAGS